MSPPRLIAIEERRLAALTDALRLALLALNTAPRFRVRDTDSYRIAAQVTDALREPAGAADPKPVVISQLVAVLDAARRDIEDATDLMHYEDGLPVTALDGADIERIYGGLCSVLVEIDEALASAGQARP